MIIAITIYILIMKKNCFNCTDSTLLKYCIFHLELELLLIFFLHYSNENTIQIDRRIDR